MSPVTQETSTATAKTPDGQVTATVTTPAPRSSMVQSILVGAMSGGTILFGLVDLLKSEPDKGFHLLQNWGPWCFLAFFVAWIINGWVGRGFNVAERVGNRWADSFDKVATEQKRLADAQEALAISSAAQAAAAQQAADKDDREADRMSTLVEFSAQQSQQALQQGRANGLLLEKIVAQLESRQSSKDGSGGS